MVVSLGACAPPTDPCLDSIVPGIVVAIVDSTTNHALAAHATGAVHDGTFSDSLKVFQVDNGTITQLAAAFERVGNYQVDVHVDGYKNWEVQGVSVVQAGCHVAKTSLLAKMQPGS